MILVLCFLLLGTVSVSSERVGRMVQLTLPNVPFKLVKPTCITSPLQVRGVHCCGTHTFFGYGQPSMEPLSSCLLKGSLTPFLSLIRKL